MLGTCVNHIRNNKRFPKNELHASIALDFSKYEIACKRRYDHIP